MLSRAVSAAQRDRYAEVYQTIAAYGDTSPGVLFLPAFLDMVCGHRGSVLDAGCGTGKMALALEAEGFSPLILADLTGVGRVPEARALPFLEVNLWDDLGAELRAAGQPELVDWVVCCDVLEHVPPVFVMLVVSRLLAVARRGVFLSICLAPDNFGVWVGSRLHETVQPFVDWRNQLAELGVVVEARDVLGNGIYLVAPC